MNRYHSLLALSLLTFISASHAAQSKLSDPPPVALVYCLADFEGQQTLFSIQIPPESSPHALKKTIKDYINDRSMNSVDSIQFNGKKIKNKQTVAAIITSSKAIDPQAKVIIIKHPKTFFHPFLWAEENRTYLLNNDIYEQIAESLKKTVQCRLMKPGVTIKSANQ